MVTIKHLQVLDNYCLLVGFNDGCQKTIDFRQFIKDVAFTRPLLDPAYFKQVRIYENGRGIYWPNGYDACPDNLRYYLPAIETEQARVTVAEENESLMQTV
jgi:hypothetical protein